MTPCEIFGRRRRIPHGYTQGVEFDADGRSWLRPRCVDFCDAGCWPVIVVLGARAANAAALLPPNSTDTLVVESDWQKGMSESLRSGLEAAQNLDAVAAVITLVDAPDLDTRTITRVIGPDCSGQKRTSDAPVFHGTPGHPVVIGRGDYQSRRAWIASLAGDSGANSRICARTTPITWKLIQHRPGRGLPTSLSPGSYPAGLHMAGYDRHLQCTTEGVIENSTYGTTPSLQPTSEANTSAGHPVRR